MSTERFCPECGTKIAENERFCPDCGADLDDGTTSQKSADTQGNPVIGAGARTNVTGGITTNSSSNSISRTTNTLTRNTNVNTSSIDNSSTVNHNTTIVMGKDKAEYCDVCGNPLGEKHARCPKCGKPVTTGVLNRVCELADRPLDSKYRPITAGTTFHLIPLVEILSEILQRKPTTKSVALEYKKLIQYFGSELAILQHVPVEELAKFHSLLGEGILRLRNNNVIKQTGYDGEYGKISLFKTEELL